MTYQLTKVDIMHTKCQDVTTIDSLGGASSAAPRAREDYLSVLVCVVNKFRLKKVFTKIFSTLKELKECLLKYQQ